MEQFQPRADRGRADPDAREQPQPARRVGRKVEHRNGGGRRQPGRHPRPQQLPRRLPAARSRTSVASSFSCSTTWVLPFFLPDFARISAVLFGCGFHQLSPVSFFSSAAIFFGREGGGVLFLTEFRFGFAAFYDFDRLLTGLGFAFLRFQTARRSFPFSRFVTESERESNWAPEKKIIRFKWRDMEKQHLTYLSPVSSFVNPVKPGRNFSELWNSVKPGTTRWHVSVFFLRWRYLERLIRKSKVGTA